MRGTIPAPRAVNAQLLASRPATCYTVAENLLANSHFDIWQRGEQIDNVGTTAYGPDMWTGNGNLARTYSRQRNGVKIITTEAGQFAGISQRRVLPLRYYADRNAMMTLRYRVYAYARDMLTYQGARAPARQWATSIWRGNLAITGEGVINCADLIGVQCLADGTDLPAGSEFTIADVELVLGEYTADTFPMVRQVSCVEEVAECQRYYLPILDGGHDMSWPAVPANPTTLDVQITFPEMLAVPRLEVSGNELGRIVCIDGAYYYNSIVGVTSLGVTAATEHSACLRVTVDALPANCSFFTYDAFSAGGQFAALIADV